MADHKLAEILRHQQLFGNVYPGPAIWQISDNHTEIRGNFCPSEYDNRPFPGNADHTAGKGGKDLPDHILHTYGGVRCCDFHYLGMDVQRRVRDYQLPAFPAGNRRAGLAGGSGMGALRGNSGKRLRRGDDDADILHQY